MVYGIAAGDLAKWLGVVAQNNEPGAIQRDIPPLMADYLVTLRCVVREADGGLKITDKGRLSLRMEAPTALHKQEDPDDVRVADVEAALGPDDVESERADRHSPDADDSADPHESDSPRRSE